MIRRITATALRDDDGAFRIEVSRIQAPEGLRCNPVAWRYDDLVGARISPAAPPTETGIGQHVVSAQGHQDHVFPGASRVGLDQDTTSTDVRESRTSVEVV